MHGATCADKCALCKRPALEETAAGIAEQIAEL